MNRVLWLILLMIWGSAVGAAEIFRADFNGDKAREEWGGAFSIVDAALQIKAEKSNPVAYLKGKKWQNYRVTFELERKSGAVFNFYSGWNYPEFVKISLAQQSKGGLTIADAKGQKRAVFDYPAAEAGKPLKIEVEACRKTITCKINGVLCATWESPGSLSGSIAFGGEWNSNFLITNLQVEQLTPPPLPEPPFKDQCVRPKIKNGTFYYNGRPTFMLGVNDTANFWEFGDFNNRPPFAPNDVFTDVMSREIAAKMGFNSLHECAMPRQAAEDYLAELKLSPAQGDLLFGAPYREHWEGRDRHRDRIAGMPLIIDYSMLHLATMQNQRERIKKAGFPAELYHDGGFMPYVPETEIGGKIYEAYFKGGAKYWLNHGRSNPWVYELFNEVQWYHSKHIENRKLFGEYLRKKYGSTEKLRAVWGDETPASFEAVANMMPWQGKVSKADWMDFLGDRFAEIFRKYKAAIQSVDPRREEVYFDIEISVASLWYEQNGIDYHKLMKEADLFGTEGGVRFGSFAASGKSYLDDVMDTEKIQTIFAYDLAASFAGEKPVMNQETYVGRQHGKLGYIPTLRTDFPTLLWFEVFHNVSGSQVYCWWQGYRNNNWKNLDEARKTSKSIPPALLNPYTYPLESLKGFKDFAGEIDRLAETALPYPRVTQEIGILYSLPSVWRQPHAVSGKQKFPYQQNCFRWYETFMRRQMPVAVITEQALIERGPGAFKVIAVPYPSHTYPKTAEKLREFAARGGIVLLGAGSCKYDQYGRPNTGKELSGKNIYTIPAGLDKGREMAALSQALDASGYRAPFQVTAAEKTVLDELEARVIRRDNMDLYFFCNWNNRHGGMGKLVPAKRKGGIFYVTDMVRMAPILSPAGKKEWQANELSAGVPLAMPSQERVLIGITDKAPAYAAGVVWDAATLQQDMQRRQQELNARLARYDAELRALEQAEQAAYKAARRPYEVKRERCVALDLRPVVNMGFKDETAGDRKGGWTDQGESDFREFPSGEFVYAGVPFKIIDPATNGGKACAVLSGSIKYFPHESGEIAVGKRVEKMYFLHCAAWGGGDGRFFDYEITYSDGTRVTMPIRGQFECADWTGTEAIKNGVIAWETVKKNGIRIGAYATCWRNPHPEKTVKAVKAVSAETPAVPIILAITAETLP